MGKRVTLALFLILWANSASAFGPTLGCSKVASGGDCVTQSVVAEQTSNSGADALYDGRQLMQKFRVDTAGECYSITIQTANVDASGDIEIRIDDDDDLSADTLATDTESVTVNYTGTITVTFTTRATLSTGTDYYFAIDWPPGDSGYGSRMNLDTYTASDNYAPSGCTGCDYYVNTTGDWSTWTQNYGDDLYFQVHSCD